MSETIPRCPQCKQTKDVHRETAEAKIKARHIPLIFKREKLDGWSCYSCNHYWPK